MLEYQHCGMVCVCENLYGEGGGIYAGRVLELYSVWDSGKYCVALNQLTSADITSHKQC